MKTRFYYASCVLFQCLVFLLLVYKDNVEKLVHWSRKRGRRLLQGKVKNAYGRIGIFLLCIASRILILKHAIQVVALMCLRRF